MNFTPSPDYLGLLKQAWSMKQLIDSMEKELSARRESDWPAGRKTIEELRKQLESEKEINDILTKEIFELKQ